jgi:hypothetical protein
VTGWLEVPVPDGDLRQLEDTVRVGSADAPA